jgi:hypothetical protein
MNAAQIKTWCLPKPRPTVLRVTVGKKVDVVHCAGQTWATLGRTVEAMQPDLIEALNDEGHLLRALRPADFGDDEEAKPETDLTPPASAYDPETVRFTLVANLLADAYKHANETAFDKLVAIADVGARRAEALEKTMATYDRMRRGELEDRIAQYEEQLTAAGGDQVTLAQLAQSFLGGQQVQKPTPPTTNGKGH